EIRIRFALTAPEVAQTIKIRSVHVYTGASQAIPNYPMVDSQPSVTASQLGIATNGVNVHRKTGGRTVYNSTDGKVYRATGSAPGAAWASMDESNTITPE